MGCGCSSSKVGTPTVCIPQPIERPADGQRDTKPEEGSAAWISQALALHNSYRKKHGAQPLQWSNECFSSAKKQAEACQQKRCLFHGNLSGKSGKHGQNAFFAVPVPRLDFVMQSWYDEVKLFDWKDKSSSANFTKCGHFTQVVWKATQVVGVAASSSGNYIVANYFPPGNHTLYKADGSIVGVEQNVSQY